MRIVIPMLMALVSNQLMATEDQQNYRLKFLVYGGSDCALAHLKINQSPPVDDPFESPDISFKSDLDNLEAHLNYSPTSQKGVMKPPVCVLSSFDTKATDAKVLFKGVDCDAVLSIQNACKFPETVFYFRGGVNLKTDRDGVVSFTSLSAPPGEFTFLVAASGFIDRGVGWPAGSYILHDRGISPATQENVMKVSNFMRERNRITYMGLNLERILSAAIDWNDYAPDSDCEKWLIRVFGEEVRVEDAAIRKEDVFKAFEGLVDAALPSGESRKLKNEFMESWMGRCGAMVSVIPTIRNMVQSLGMLYKQIGRMNPRYIDLAGDCGYMKNDAGEYVMSTSEDTTYELMIDPSNPAYRVPTLVKCQWVKPTANMKELLQLVVDQLPTIGEICREVCRDPNNMSCQTTTSNATGAYDNYFRKWAEFFKKQQAALK